MTKSDKKSKDTIVITKKNLYLFIFLAVIAIAVAIAVPATIHLKQKHSGSGGSGGESPVKPITTQEQIGDDGYIFAHFVEDSEPVRPVYDDGLINAVPEKMLAYPDCVSIDEKKESVNGSDDGAHAITNCISMYTVYGEESDYQNQILTNATDFEDVFGFKSNYYNDDFFMNKNIAVVIAHIDFCSGYIDNVYLMHDIEEDTYTTNVDIVSTCGVCADEAYVYFIEYDPEEYIEEIDGPEYLITESEECDHEFDDVVVKKPVIYLYPTSTTNVDVKLGAPEKLTVSYPKYDDAWKVTANPDGSLVDRKTGRELYSLYYEADYTTAEGVHEDGFVVKGADTAKFLEEKLAQLGLNEREAEEFIIYWLPQLEKNAYNYIYFAPVAEIAENMPLNVSPAPETIIRINMEYKALDAPIQVKEQKLPATPIRKGFTLVEWGGTSL